jgi:probable rRNA maturation factor
MVILHKPVAGLNERSLERFVVRAKRAAGLRGAVTVLVTTGTELRSLNHRFRGKDKPTDVLSFPAEMMSHGRFAGDVAISADIAAKNARRLGHTDFCTWQDTITKRTTERWRDEKVACESNWDYRWH